MALAISISACTIAAAQVLRNGSVHAALRVSRSVASRATEATGAVPGSVHSGDNLGGESVLRLKSREGVMLLEAMDRAGFKAEPADVAIDAAPYSGVYEVPPRNSGAPIARLAKAELARAYRIDPSEIEAAVMEAPRPVSSRARDADHVLAIGLARRVVMPLMLDLDHAGIEPRRATLPHMALCARAMQESGVAEAIAVIDLSWSGAHLTVALRDDTSDIWGGAVPCFVRHISEASIVSLHDATAIRIGGSVDLASEVLGITGCISGFDISDSAAHEAARCVATAVRPLITTYLDALATETARSIAYVSHRHPASPITRVLVCGDGAGLPGVCDRLAGELGFDVSLLTPAAMVQWPEGLEHFAYLPSMSPVVALAIESSQRSYGPAHSRGTRTQTHAHSVPGARV